MPIDPSMLAKSIGTLTDLHPDQDLPATLQQAVIAAKQLFDADAAGIMLTDLDGNLRWASASDQRAQTLEDNQEVFAAGPCAEAFNTSRPAIMHDATTGRRWGEITLVFVEVEIRSALSVPVELGGGPIGTLDVYAADPRGWDDTEVTAAVGRLEGLGAQIEQDLTAAQRRAELGRQAPALALPLLVLGAAAAAVLAAGGVMLHLYLDGRRRRFELAVLDALGARHRDL